MNHTQAQCKEALQKQTSEYHTQITAMKNEYEEHVGQWQQLSSTVQQWLPGDISSAHIFN